MNVISGAPEHSIKTYVIFPEDCPRESMCENAEKSHSAEPSNSVNTGPIELEITPFDQELQDVVSATEITYRRFQNVWKCGSRNFIDICIFIDFAISNRQKVAGLQYHGRIDTVVELEWREKPWSTSLTVPRVFVTQDLESCKSIAKN